MSLPSNPAQGKNPRTTTIALTAVLIVITAILWITYFVTGSEWNTPSIHWLPLAILATISSLVIFSLRITWTSSKKPSSFNLWIYGVTIIGGSIAFLFPLAIADYIGKDSEGSALRQMIIYATGGLLGAITLSETRRKNDLERSKFDKQNDQFTEQLNAQKENLKTELEAQKENLKTQLDAQKENLKTELEAQKENLKTQLESQLESQKEQINSQNEKDIRDHIRQVHAERRSRYTKAVEQLADDKAAVRLGGIYTLIGLVDEWLADENIKERDSRRKEGQVIINNLCSYIRSPFNLAEKRGTIEVATNPDIYSGNLNEDKAKLREEQGVRQTIFSEISNHLAESTKNSSTDDYWKGFNYNFSKSNIFYNLTGLTFSNPNFSNAEFNGPADFTGSRFLGKAIFKNTTFNSETYMSDRESAKTTFEGEVDFTGSIFKGKATFKSAIFNSLAYFSDIDSAKTTFDSEVDFTGSTFIGDAIFRNTTFTLTATFSSEYSSRTNFEAGSDFSLSTFTHNANFSNVNFHQYSNFELTSFGGMAKFVTTNFYGSAQFSIWGGPQYSQDYSFSGDANFTDAYFKEGASFTERHFEKSAVFRNAIFEGPAYFDEGRITDRGIFTNTIFKDSSRFTLYNFGNSTDFKEAKFSTDRAHEFDRTQNIALGSVPIDIGWPQNQIPLGSRYGLLNSWDSKTKSFTVTSDPAK